VKLALLQNASGAYVPLLRATFDHHRRYCERHNILYLPTFGRVRERDPKWDRFPLLGQLCEESAVVWLDADCVIVGDADLREMFNGVSHIGMAKYTDIGWKDWGFHWNSGVMAVRDTFTAWQFIQRVWAIGQLENAHGWVNQPAIQQAAEETGVDEISIRWNCPTWLHCDKPVVKSFHSHRGAALPFLENELAMYGI